MGEATDRKVAEIEQPKARLESDLRELEARVRAPLDQMKALASMVLANANTPLRPLEVPSKGGPDERAAEVVVRIVREDV